MSQVPPQALDDLLILDFSRILAGPYATMLLGDYGARIIKVEEPNQGDDTRAWGPPFTAYGESAYFLCANRNKQSITLNIKDPRGQTIARQLIEQADIVVENFKVGAMASMGLDYMAAAAINPAIIYCSITGYGQTGPDRNRPGYDAVIEAEGGIMSITGPKEGDDGLPAMPYKVGVAIADITAGLQATTAILAALHHRTRTGEGQYIDIALLDSQVGWLANVASAYLVSGNAPQRYGNAHPSIVPYQIMRAADGFLMLAVGNDRQFAALCQCLDRPDLSEDQRFSTNASRVTHRHELLAQLHPIFAAHSVAKLTEILHDAGVPSGPVNDIPTALAHPQVAAREMVQELHDREVGTVPQIGPVAKMSGTPPQIKSRPPLLGEDTDKILSTLLHYTKSQIDSLRRDEVI